jgi:hypothetical protein
MNCFQIIDDDNRCFWSITPIMLGIFFLVLSFMCYNNIDNNLVLFIILFSLFLVLSILFIFIGVYISNLWKSRTLIRKKEVEKI